MIHLIFFFISGIAFQEQLYLKSSALYHRLCMEKRQARLLVATEAAGWALQELSNLQMTPLQSSHSADSLLYSPLSLSLPIAIHRFSLVKFVVFWLHRWNGSLTAPHEHFQHG
jgi:hypothetical protein